MAERILLTYPRRHDPASTGLVAAAREAITAAGFVVIEPPEDQTTGAKLRQCLRGVRAVVALYLPVIPANRLQPMQKTSSWPEAAVSAARAGIGSSLDCIVVTQSGIDDFGLAKSDNCLITTPYDPQDGSTLDSITERLRRRLANLRDRARNCLIWTLNFDLAGFTARVAENGEAISALTEEQATRANEAKERVASIVYDNEVQPDHVIDTGDGGYFVYEGAGGCDGEFLLNLARRVRQSFASPSEVHLAISAGQVTKCYSVAGGTTYIGHPMNAAARINTSEDGGIHVDENVLHVCANTQAARELSALASQSLEAKHGQVFKYRSVPVKG